MAEDTVQFRVVWKKRNYEVTFPLDHKVAKLKEHIQQLTGVFHVAMVMMYVAMVMIYVVMVMIYVAMVMIYVAMVTIGRTYSCLTIYLDFKPLTSL